MITRKMELGQPSSIANWQQEFRQAIRKPLDLISYLGLENTPEANQVWHIQQDFGLRVPWPYVQRMHAGDWNDPLLRQVLPLQAEQLDVPGFIADPLVELSARRAPALLHKYHGRVLLMLTGACAVHCRYCFRRHYPYAEDKLWHDPAALAYIRADTSIQEVILSGGDPLSIPDERLADLLEQLAAIPHLRRLRIHTRFPVVIPQRITHKLLQLLSETRLQTVMVVHINHAQEIDLALAQGLREVAEAGVWMLNQSVLLRGINDNAAALCALSEALGELHIQPYYLHLLDPVAGAAHFDVTEAQAVQLMEAVRLALPGYLVPRLAKESVDLGYKQLI